MALSFVMTVIMLSCKTTNNVNTSSENKLSQSQYYHNTSLFIDAKRAEFKGDLAEAIDILKKLISKDEYNHAAFYELSKLLPKAEINAAISYAEKALKISPENRWYMVNLSTLYVNAGDFKNAAAVDKKLVKKYPTDIQNYYRLVNSYLKAEDYDNAIETYRNIEKKFGYNEEVLLQRKNILYKKGDYQNALKELDIAISHNPDEKRLYGMAADIYMAKGDTKNAIKYYDKILELDPQDGKVHLVLANYYYSIGNKEKSFAEMKTAFANINLDVFSKVAIMAKLYAIVEQNKDDISLKQKGDTLLNLLNIAHPNDPIVLALNGDNFSKSKNWVQAKDAYEKVIKIDSTKYLFWEQLILIDRELNDYSAMKNHSERALMIFPQYPIIYFFNAKANFNLSRYEAAEASLNRGLSFIYKDQQKLEFYTFLGEVRDSLKHFEEADIAFQKALMVDANYSQALKSYSLHIILINGNRAEALEMSKKALELNQGQTEYIYLYAKVLYFDKQFDEAFKWAKSAVDILPNDKIYNQLLGDILNAQGKTMEAKEYLLKAR